MCWVIILAQPAYDLTSSERILRTPDLEMSGWCDVDGVVEAERPGGAGFDVLLDVELDGIVVAAG